MSKKSINLVIKNLEGLIKFNKSEKEKLYSKIKILDKDIQESYKEIEKLEMEKYNIKIGDKLEIIKGYYKGTVGKLIYFFKDCGELIIEIEKNGIVRDYTLGFILKEVKKTRKKIKLVKNEKECIYIYTDNNTKFIKK